MKEHNLDMELRKDVTDQTANIKDIVYDLSKVLQLGYDTLVMKEESMTKKDTCVSFIGVSAYVTSKIDEELGILMELIDTM